MCIQLLEPHQSASKSLAMERNLDVKNSIKVACFVWLLAKEAVLTQDNLKKRERPLCSRCFFCGETAETVNHLFLQYKITSQLWRLFLSLKSMSWTMPAKITEAIQSWEEAGKQSKNRDRWRIVPASIWWQYGRKGTLELSIVLRIVCKKSN